jgi:hypothetical protein
MHILTGDSVLWTVHRYFGVVPVLQAVGGRGSEHEGRAMHERLEFERIWTNRSAAYATRGQAVSTMWRQCHHLALRFARRLHGGQLARPTLSALVVPRRTLTHLCQRPAAAQLLHSTLLPFDHFKELLAWLCRRT